MSETPYLPVFELTRGGIVESIHFGAFAVVDARGKLVASHGDDQVYTFLRSSAKPFQAMPFVEHGGPAAFHLTPKEVAIICASHAGTDEHYQTVSGIQTKTGVSENDLMCGTHPLTDPETVEAMRQRGEEVTSNRHNCSGKHTGMLAYVHLKGLPLQPTEAYPAAYINPSHPIQQDILQNFAEMCEMPEEKIVVGVDGCSAPNFAVPLYNAALGLARLCDPSDLPETKAAACRTIFSAMTAHPFMVGGPKSFDTALMETAGGRILCKGGAEGYQIMGVAPGALGAGSPGLGIAIKISDGDLGAHVASSNGHARPAVALEILRQLGLLSQPELEKMAYFGPTFKVLNWRKVEAGEGYPCFKI